MATKNNAVNQEVIEQEKRIENIEIGYVMPIAKTDGYPESHWVDVKQILDDTVRTLGIKDSRIVSDGGDITTIHSRIVGNLFKKDIVICDVSSRNPNVMFELGMRIAFDKPVIIIKDEVTNYCFDSGTIEHIPYPKDLRHGLINDFKKVLSSKINFTFEKYLKNKDDKLSPILRNFGSFDRANIEIDSLSANESLIQDIRSIKDVLVKMQMTSVATGAKKNKYKDPTYVTERSIGQLKINLDYFNDESQKSLFEMLSDYKIKTFSSSDGDLLVYGASEDVLDKIASGVAFMYKY